MQLRAVQFVPEKMTKRNLFAEMTEGFDALASARKGKKTLRTTQVELKPAVEISADELVPFAKSSTCHALCSLDT